MTTRKGSHRLWSCGILAARALIWSQKIVHTAIPLWDMVRYGKPDLENSKISVSGPGFSLEGHSKVAVGGRVSYAYVAILLLNSTSWCIVYHIVFGHDPRSSSSTVLEIAIYIRKYDSSQGESRQGVCGHIILKKYVLLKLVSARLRFFFPQLRWSILLCSK
jgi:hypothetical protein